MEAPLLVPVINADEADSQATFLDRHGDVLTLPDNALVPFGRSAARATLRRIKRFRISDIYRLK